MFNRRIAKRMDDNGDGQFDRAERYAYDGKQIVIQFDGLGNLTHRYLYGTAVDQVLADEQVNDAGGTSNILWPLADNLGTVRDLADFDPATQETTIANHLVYDAFGRITQETNPAVDHLFGFTGRETDEESDLNYYRARYYDPALGRFLSEDPIGLAAGDENLAQPGM